MASSAQVDLYTFTFGQYIHVLESLIALLTKASKAPDADTLVTATLHEDMRDFTFQVMLVNVICHKAALRIVGKDFGDSWGDEKTLPELITRTRTTLERIKSIRPDQVNGKESTLVTLERASSPTLKLPAIGYALSYSGPNLFFHLTAAYAILRMKGVPLGKTDYLAPFGAPFESYTV